jgi:FMN phosphatase YigB (HAD superfamily)
MARGSAYAEDARLQEVKLAASVHLALDELELGDLAFGLSAGPSPAMLEPLVHRSGLADAFDAVLSVDAVRVFKAHPRVYHHALDALGLPAQAIAFQSSNASDAYAASDFGMHVVWCNRCDHRRERLPGAPDFEIRSLAASKLTVPWRLYSLSRAKVGCLPGSGVRSGAVVAIAWMPGFSS